MVKALFYKEWIKTRTIVFLAVALIAGFVAYTFINTAQMFRVSGAVNVWNNVITKDMSLLSGAMQWLPVLAGLMLALAQFVPEMTDKRLKLTLHLPLREGTTVSIMLAYGLLVLLAVFALTYGVLTAGFSAYYPCEMIAGMIWRSLPWFIAGLCAYLLAAWVCFEPVWRQRIFNALIGVCLCSFFFIAAPSRAYIPMLPWMIAFTVVCFAFPFYSASRFKDGAQ